MVPTRKGTIRLFRFSGIDVFLHWSWFLVAIYEINSGGHRYSSIAWNVLEYLALFVIVTIHEFGHALACRQVGGAANQIVLWPLGGVAYVSPPQRPGAFLWSLAAGPLVNVTFVPILFALGRTARLLGWAQTNPDLFALLQAVWWINLVLLIFNMLPIYPLDGGQILRSLLWFVLGRAKSLIAATVIGFFGVAGLIALAVWTQSAWTGIIAIYILLNCWSGMRQALALWRIERAPLRLGFACPSCKAAPPVGDYWICGKCRARFDTFQAGAVCPHCSAQFPITSCIDCHMQSPIDQWSSAIPVAPDS
jgi:Zn-dependent protease